MGPRTAYLAFLMLELRDSYVRTFWCSMLRAWIFDISNFFGGLLLSFGIFIFNAKRENLVNLEKGWVLSEK